MKRALIGLLIVAAVGAGAGAYYVRRGGPDIQITTASITRGDIVDTVGATGTLQAVTTVLVGSQVSGNISWLGADFNTIVKKGQVIARLDPSMLDAQLQQARANLAQARANLTKAQSDLDRARVQLVDAQQKYTRAKELAARSLLPQSELDAAKVAVDTAKAGVASQQATVAQTQAGVAQSQASVNQNQVNLDHTVIVAPIDGIVTQRSVDVGQTVAASMQAPTLFVIAADLTKMQVNANIDEADVGRIRPGQHVTFHVDAYPTETFEGTVSQVRLQPVVVQNVTTYGTVIDVPNPELKLKPGMTANVKVEIAKRTNVLRVPNPALRFRPTPEVFADPRAPRRRQARRPPRHHPTSRSGAATRAAVAAEGTVPALAAARGEWVNATPRARWSASKRCRPRNSSSSSRA
jgi:HlyD family secretion protein